MIVIVQGDDRQTQLLNRRESLELLSEWNCRHLLGEIPPRMLDYRTGKDLWSALDLLRAIKESE